MRGAVRRRATRKKSKRPFESLRRRCSGDRVAALPARVSLFFDGLVVMLSRDRKRVEFVKDELVAVGVVEGVKGGHPLERVLRLQVCEGARIELVPGGIPAR